MSTSDAWYSGYRAGSNNTQAAIKNALDAAEAGRIDDALAILRTVLTD
jgi:hypothetical protein